MSASRPSSPAAAAPSPERRLRLILVDYTVDGGLYGCSCRPDGWPHRHTYRAESVTLCSDAVRALLREVPSARILGIREDGE